MKKKKKIVCALGIAGVLLTGVFFCLFFMGNIVHAAGLVDDTVDVSNLYSKYSLKNYQLDFYVDNSWGWLPWKWMGTAGNTVMYGLYSLTNVVWTLSLYISNATGYVVQEAYKLNFIGDMANSIGTNIQTIAGVSSKGFSSSGLYVRLLPWLVVIVGTYAAYCGLIKHESSKALSAVMNFLVIFIFSSAFIAYAPDYIKKINEFSVDMSTAMLDVGTKITVPGSNVEGEDSVDLIRDSLFSVQIYQPWLLLQYGTTDEEAIGSERIERLLSAAPSNEDEREKVVKEEIETQSNTNLSTPEVGNRLGMVLFLFVFNIGISIFVFLLTGIMILSQILFIIFSMFLPMSFLISMVPSQQGKWKQAVMKVFNTIVMRSGIALVITVAFSLSSMFYSMTAGYPFFLIAFLQIVVFAGIFMQLQELLGMLSLQSGDADRLGRRMFYRPYRRMRYGMRRIRRDVRRTSRRGAIAGGKNTVNDSVRSSSGYVGKNEKTTVQSGKSVRPNIKPNIGTKTGKAVQKVIDVPSKVVDGVKRPIEKIVDLPTGVKYAVHSVGTGFKEELAENRERRTDRQKQRREMKNYKREEMAEAAEKRKEKRAEKRGCVAYQNLKGTGGNENTSEENKKSTEVGKSVQMEQQKKQQTGLNTEQMEQQKKQQTGLKSRIKERKRRKAAYENAELPEKRGTAKDRKTWNDLGGIPKTAVVNQRADYRKGMTEWKSPGKTEKNVTTKQTRYETNSQSDQSISQYKGVPEKKYVVRAAKHTPYVKVKNGQQRMIIAEKPERKRVKNETKNSKNHFDM